MKRFFIALSVLAVLAACQSRNEVIAFDGNYYRTDLDKGDDPRMFAVSARPVSASLEGARRAAEYEAFTYCINQYGSSKIRWAVGPEQDPSTYRIVDDTLTLQGVCPG